MTELIKNINIIPGYEITELNNGYVNESVLEILDVDNINSSFGKLIISQNIVNIDISKPREELIDDFFDFGNSIIKEYKDKYEKDFKDNKNGFSLLDFYVTNGIKEPLKNSFDSFISAHALGNDKLGEISFKMYERDNGLVFIIRDNGSGALAASTSEKNDNEENYIGGRGVGLCSLDKDGYGKYCKSSYRVGKEGGAVTKVVMKILD